MKAFLARPIECDWPYLWIDATYGRIVSFAVIVAVGVNSDSRREVLGMDIGPSEAETCWTAFLRKLARRGLRGVKLVVSDAHEGITVTKVLNARWQRCCVRPLHAQRAGACRQARPPRLRFHRHRVCPGRCRGRTAQWRKVADPLRPKLPKLASFLDEAETEVLSDLTSRRCIGPSCTPPTRLIASTARSSGGPRWSASSPTRMPSSTGAILLEQSDEWAVQRAHCMRLEPSRR
jgi:putative transposase